MGTGFRVWGRKDLWHIGFRVQGLFLNLGFENL